MTTERANWKDVTPEDATDEELHLVHKIFGPKPVTMESDTWRRNMRSCAKEIREHVKMQLAAAKEDADCRNRIAECDAELDRLELK